MDEELELMGLNWGKPRQDPRGFTTTDLGAGILAPANPLKLGFSGGSTPTAATTPGDDFWSWKGFMGTKETPGWGNTLLGTLQGFGNAFMAMKQYNLAKDTFEAQKANADRNYQAQKQIVNSQFADRDLARNAATGGRYAYNDLAKYGLS